MKKINTLLITIISMQLLACGPDKTPPPKFFNEQRTVLNKAKAVEDTVQQKNQNMQQSLEKQAQ